MSHSVRPRALAALTLATFVSLGAGPAACAGGVPAGRAPAARSAPSSPAPAPVGDAALERAVLAELNRMRADPPGYAATLEALLPHFEGNVLRRPGERVGLMTQEGATAVREAVRALRATRPVPPLRASAGLAAAARDHVRDQGPRGLLGHVGTDRSSTADRASRYGRWLGRLTENIDYGAGTGRDVVASLVVDDGVPDRGHRRNALDPSVSVAGVACGPHAKYRRMCVIVHAGGYEERR